MQKGIFWGIVIQKTIEWMEDVGQSNGLVFKGSDLLSMIFIIPLILIKAFLGGKAS
tara:strand:- start:26 stop:193 length:168 start_codon:yes stop_codon:yes gene_type:complete